MQTEWDPVLDVPTDDWPAGAYLLRLDADSGAQRYVPVTVRSASTAGRVVLKNCVPTWQAYNTWGGYDLYTGRDAGQSYGSRSLAVSLDRPYDLNGADMFLTYERNVVKLAESMGLPLAYVTSMDIAADPDLLAGASALISPGHDEYWTPGERANVTAARDAGVNLAFLGANAVFRRIRLDSGGRLVICYKTSYTEDPLYGKDNALVTSDWREPPDPDPESSLIGTIYEGYPAVAPYVVVAPDSWLFAGTGAAAGDRFANLVGIEYDRVNPAYPVPRPIQVLSHSPLVCQGAASFGDSAYYTHPGGAGVFNSGTMRWVEAIYGDSPHGIGGRTSGFRQAGDRERAARLRRRPGGGEVPGARQPGRHARVRRRPHRQPRQPAVSGYTRICPRNWSTAALRLSTSRASRCSPSAADAPAGSPSTPLALTARTPRSRSSGRISPSGRTSPRSAVSSRTAPGASASMTEVSDRPACASPSGRAACQARQARPS